MKDLVGVYPSKGVAMVYGERFLFKQENLKAYLLKQENQQRCFSERVNIYSYLFAVVWTGSRDFKQEKVGKNKFILRLDKVLFHSDEVTDFDKYLKDQWLRVFSKCGKGIKLFRQEKVGINFL